MASQHQMRIESYGPKRNKLHFPCPRIKDRECFVLLKPWPIIGAATWTWNENAEKPTLTPSINCGTCGWHGFIVDGKLTNV